MRPPVSLGIGILLTMLLITLVLTILLGTLILLYQWCQFRMSDSLIAVARTTTNDHNTAGFKPDFYDFLSGKETCQIWAFNFTMPHTFHDFSEGFSANIGALRSQWSNSESFRFILVAYVNIFILVLIYAYVFLKNLNQYMEERRKARGLAASSKKKHRIWGTNANAAAPERFMPSYIKLPTAAT